MAESKVCKNERVPADFDSDTPVPAAEVLIDLKESARRRRAHERLRTSPRKRKSFTTSKTSESPKKTPNHRSSSRRLDFTNDLGNSASEFSEEEEEDEGSSLPLRKSRRLLAPGGSQESLSPSKQRPDQAILHAVGNRLRNLLKLPKAHKWCYYEWFYSDIDQPLLEGENDFRRCLTDMFPELKTRQLSRVQWRQLRRLMGKPRRCSPTFFTEERTLMDHRRNKVRQLQQQVHQGIISVSDFSTYHDIPDEIPTLMVVGTAVTARLHTEIEKGFYTGRIEAVDIDSHRYWVTFDRPGLGKHAILDTEIRSAKPPEVISIPSLEAAHRTQWPPPREDYYRGPPTPPRLVHHTDPSAMHALLSPDALHADPFLTSSPARRKILIQQNDPLIYSRGYQVALPERVGGFPVEFLKQVAQLSKLLSLKQQMIQRITEMNTEAEKAHARQRTVSVEFQRQYATVILDLEDMNKHLNSCLDAIRSHCEVLGYSIDVGPSSMDAQQHAQKITESANTSLEATGSEVKDTALLDLISRLTGLLLQIEVLSESSNPMEVSSLTRSIEEIEARIHPRNRRHFQDNVETPLTLVQSGMNPVGTLHAFSVGRPLRLHNTRPTYPDP